MTYVLLIGAEIEREQRIGRWDKQKRLGKGFLDKLKVVFLIF